MSRKDSESLLGSSSTAATRPVVTRPEDRVIPSSRSDYLFKDDRKNEDQVAQELRVTFEARMRQAQELGMSAGHRGNERLSPEEQADSDILDRMNERNRRHRTPDGDIVVWCKVRRCDTEPGLSVQAVTVPVDPRRPLPDFEESGCFIVRSVFKQPTAVERKRIDPLMSYESDDERRTKRFDHDQHCLQLFRLCFKEWNLPVELPRCEGRLTNEALETLQHVVHPCLLDEIGDSLFELIEPTDLEVKQLQRQCDRMFAKNSDGVKFACEGVRAYCDATSAKDLGVVTNHDVMTWRTHLLISLVVQKKNEIERKEMEEAERKSKAKSPPRGARR